MSEIGIGRGIVNADIQPTMRRPYVIEGRVNIFHVTHVTGKCLSATAGITNGCCNLCAIINLAAGDNDMGALLGKQARCFFTNTAAGAADEGYLSGEIK
jgi:hypothetical protein